MITVENLRETFLRFFESKSHTRIRSSSLVPESDPTLFFTNAGMVQFKDIFLGQQKPASVRATSSQKCMRVSGKHNDLENVGRTHRHHTFFEMLGNFSFGDYFKEGAIQFAWEFLTEQIKLDPQKLWITVFEEDDEAAEIWQKKIGIPLQRIVRLGEKENFWSMGEEGPCGPCSEIHFDHGPDYGCGQADCKVGCECERYMEIWNLVFMQYNRAASGELMRLPKPSVDTGMGLERLSAVVQGKFSNYASDLFTPIFHAIESEVGVSYGQDEKQDISMRVLADHIRACVFLIGDGIQPSNEGRGYVLRRILRRAIRHGRILGKNDAFFYRLAQTVIDRMGSAYPELIKNQTFITSVIRAEEGRFLETLEKGLEIIHEEFKKHRAVGEYFLPGDVVFRLYDTFGFPVDLIQNMADEEGFEVDIAGFEEAMLDQKESARRSWKGSGQERVASVYQELVSKGIKTEFLGYESLQAHSSIVSLIRHGEEVREVVEGDEVQLVALQTPFYGESGGQVGDTGIIRNVHFRMEVTDTRKPVEGLVVHIGKIVKGSVKISESIELEVDLHHRAPVRLNHTATHLLHAALRNVLGDHVRQAGSLVAPDRLRFDFSHFEPLDEDVLEAIEAMVNEKIREDLCVQKIEMTYDQALKKGAMALFGEKYGDRVRVLQIDDFSVELCGGTHVSRTGEIGFLKIIQESSVAAGVRRIEAVTGSSALAYCRHLEKMLRGIATRLKVNVDQIPERIDKVLVQAKRSEREISELKSKMFSGSAIPNDFSDRIRQKKDFSLLAIKTEIGEIHDLRQLADRLLQAVGRGIVLLLSIHDARSTLILKVSKDLTEIYKAGELIKPLLPFVKGSGGGRPEMAQAGGAVPESVEALFDRFYQIGELQ